MKGVLFFLIFFVESPGVAENQKIKNIMFNPIISCEKLLKTFVFEKEDTQQSTIVDYELNLLG